MPDLPLKRFPWWAVRLAGPFVPMFREIVEMRYLWRGELHMRNDRLVAFLGAEPRTPIDTAVAETLSSLGCLWLDPPNTPDIRAVSRGNLV